MNDKTPEQREACPICGGDMPERNRKMGTCSLRCANRQSFLEQGGKPSTPNEKRTCPAGKTLSLSEAAQMLGVSERKIILLLEAGKIFGRVQGHDGTRRVYFGSVVRYAEAKKKEKAQ